ncbi:MAG: hypothetical protein WBQ76_16150 [Candidatus Korobacteraceae bacterium]
MSGKEKIELAKQYVDAQLKVVEQHRKSSKKISHQKYSEMVAKVAKEIVCT